MFRKLQVRLTAVCAVGTTLVLIAMAAVSFHFSTKQLRQQRQAHFDSIVSSVCYVARNQPAISHAWILETEAAENVWVDIRSRDYAVTVEINGELREQLMTIAMEHAREAGFDPLLRPSNSLSPDTLDLTVHGAEGRYRAAISSVATERGVLCVTVLENEAWEQQQIARLMVQYVACTIAAILCLIIFAWLFTGQAVRPVEEGRRQQTEFVSAASHELRSPLAVVQVSAEKIQEAATPEAARRYGEMIARECARLSRLTGDLLCLAGADSQNWLMHMEEVYPDAILLNAVESYEQVAEQRGIGLRVNLPTVPPPKILCDSQRIEQALAVLLDNALQFTPREGKILAALHYSRGRICFTVSDSGPGVPEEIRTEIFARFFQGDRSRAGKEHFGLGLSIAKEIIAMHSGALNVGDSAWGGAEFSISLPVIQAK